MPEHFQLWRRFTKEDYSSELRNIEGLNNLDPSKGTLICLPGFSTTHDNYPEISGYMGIAQELLGGRQVDTNLVAISYPSTEGEKPNVNRHNQDPLHYTSDGAKEFADTILIPLIKSGQDINILSKSYGSIFFKMAMNEVRRQGIDYDPAKIRLLAYSNIARLNYDLPHQATEIYIDGANDSKAARLNQYKQPPPSGHDGITLTPLTPSVLHVHADIPERGLLWDASPHKLELKPLHDPERHTTRMYTTMMPNSSVAHMMRHMLCNMLTLKGKAYTIESALEHRLPLTQPQHDIGHNEVGYPQRLVMRLKTALQRGAQNRKIEAVLFDWDLTLANGEEVNLKALNTTFRAMAEQNFIKPDLANWDKQTMRQRFVGTVDSFFQEAYGEFGGDAVEKAKKEFRRLREEMRGETVLMPGTKELLRELLENGIKIGIVSNKDKGELIAQKEMLLPEAEFKDMVVVGKEPGRKGKPARDPLFAALALLKIEEKNASSVLMVGDQIRSDIHAALAAGCKPCLIGEDDRDSLFTTEARHFLDKGSDDKGNNHAVVQHQNGNAILYVKDLNMLGEYLRDPQLKRASGFAL